MPSQVGRRISSGRSALQFEQVADGGSGIKLYLRIRYVRSGEQPYLRNLPLRVDKPNWPIAKSHVPYALSVPLDEGDVSKDEKGRPVLVQIQGQALQSQNELLVLVHAMVPEMGGDFVEEHWYRIPKDVAFGRYHEISVDYDRPSRSWRGWRAFEKSQEFEWAEGDG